MTLTSTANSAVTKMATALTVFAAGNTVPAGTLVLDTLPGLYGTSNSPTSSVQWYSPQSSIARAIKVVSAGNDASATFSVKGYDLYGYPMTENITGVSGATASGKKAFKFVSSVTPAGTLSGSNVSVGTQDVFGFPIQSAFWASLDIYWNSAFVTSITGWTAASTTTPATSVTGDVRGTYNVQSAADGVKILQVYCNIDALMTQNMPTTGLFGVTQA
jgi:hypothetical protein